MLDAIKDIAKSLPNSVTNFFELEGGIAREYNAAPCDCSRNKHAAAISNALKDVVKPFQTPVGLGERVE